VFLPMVTLIQSLTHMSATFGLVYTLPVVMTQFVLF